MLESDRDALISLIKLRINDLEAELSDSRSLAERKQNQDDDASANLDLNISASVDEAVIAEHKVELIQLTKSLSWLQSEDAGFCDDCGCEIPLPRLKAVLSTRVCVECAAKNDG